MTKHCFAIHDVETTINNTSIGKTKSFAFYDENYAVYNGVKINGEYYITRNDSPDDIIRINAPEGYLIKLIIGHNWKFDLHYLAKHQAEIDGIPVRDWIAQNHIWDTQTAEYILTSHYNKYPSLDQCSEKYGGTLKDDRIKIMWDANIPTETMMPEMLEEYLEGDLDNTGIVFKEQLKAAKESGQLPLIRAMNDANLAYQEMEWNGMKIDYKELIARGRYLTKKRDALVTLIKTKFIVKELINNLNLKSTKQLSLLIFGGDFDYVTTDLVGKYKNGNDKYKKVTHTITDPLFNLSKLAKPEWKKAKWYSTDDKVLTSLAYELPDNSPAVEFIKYIQELRALDKEISGYYDSIPKILCDDCRIHQNINNCATSTGRLSESDPNLQNLSKKGKSRVKKMFISRWGKDGVIMDVDYKQLEVIGLAFISGCPDLIADIIEGKDVHNETWKKVKHLMPKHMRDDEQRRVVKGVNFGLIYGGGAKTISKESGLPMKIVKEIIKAFYGRYPGVREWQDSLQDQLTVLRETVGRTDKGFPRQMGILNSITGRSYSFLTYDAPEWVRNKVTSFSPTQLKNYPIQGFATGDVVPTVIGVLFRKLLNNPRLRNLCLLVNTVHDSIILDCHKSILEEAYEVVKSTTEGAPSILKEVFNIDFNLPLKVDITAGRNWKQQQPITDFVYLSIIYPYV